MTVVLDDTALETLPPNIAIPSYDRDAVSCGIVHLGVGYFHRAHQALYSDDILGAGDLDWGISGVCFRSPDMRDRMQPQNCLYTLAERSNGKTSLRIIGAIKEVLYAPENARRVLDRLDNPATKIVTLTITEKGYLWPDHVEPVWRSETFCDQASPALLFLVEGLWRRWKIRARPFALLSCDNLATNGKVLKGAILRLAADRDPVFHDWLMRRLACPSSMVDRIVPKTTPEFLVEMNGVTGVEDTAAVVTEPFRQWVVEDDFPLGRPDWQEHGVTITDDVAPYEKTKLRCLNGAHTFMALYGQLADLQNVSDVMANMRVGTFLDYFWAQTSKTLRADHDLRAYFKALKARFANAALKHGTAQIAVDTSQKISQRILAPLVDLQREGEDTRAHCFVVALWMAYLLGKSGSGRQFTIDDPLAQVLQKRASSREIGRFVTVGEIFPKAFADDASLLLQIAEQFARVTTAGVEEALADFLDNARQGAAA